MYIYNDELNAYGNDYSNDSDNPEIFSNSDGFYQSYNEIPYKYEPYKKDNYLLSPTLDDIVNVFSTLTKTEEKCIEPTFIEEEQQERTIIQINEKNEIVYEKTENQKNEIFENNNNNNNEKNINNENDINNKDNSNIY